MKKNVLLIAVLILIVGSLMYTSESSEKSIRLDKNWREATLPYSSSVVCTLKLSTTTVFEEERLSVEANIDDTPTILTFVDIDTDTPSIIGNLGDREPLIKIENGNVVYLMERTGFGNINIFTLFRDKNIMIMSKQYDLIGMPFGLLMIGDCLSGV